MRQLMIFVAVGALLGVVLGPLVGGTGCGEPGHREGTGDLAVQVAFPKVFPGLARLTYQVLRGQETIASQEGVLHGAVMDASALFVGLPVAEEYQVTVTGRPTDGTTVCLASGKSRVSAHVTTTLVLTLACAPAPAMAHIVTSFACPQIASVTAAPTTTSVGGKVQLRSEVYPSDGEVTSYLWTASLGQLAEPTAALTTFTCTGAGTAVLELMTTRGSCSDRMAMDVTCVGAAP